ncbi:hypothetical protein C4K68_25365 [Pokkaliibacter plantistimulans]|uniref:Glycosyltransferase 61 catalytic domain-containing protein n=1 Tax=Proteobacteria bacterium 228 TaxID=2083153 RepID=A0A2S5KJ39_9PROT|nr:glycosyltransferase family 61 protein [Pokkaliibacter plantistimulans]PPC74645.1 hypothetical protein C4K68_25365 [Pokkaliibacter plantistimulans]
MVERKWGDHIELIGDSIWRPSWLDDAIPHVTPSINFYNKVYVFPSKMDKKSKTVSYNIYTENLNPIAECEYQRGRSYNIFNYIDEIRDLGHYETIEKPVIYCGWINPHYGHFLMESLARLWCCEYLNNSLLDKCYFYFDIHTSAELPLEKSWLMKMLAAFNINTENILLGNKFYKFDSLIVPSPAIILHRNVSLEHQSYTWGTLTKNLKSSLPEQVFQNVYVSRSGLKKDKRSLSNEIELEAELRNKGFLILNPESVSLEEQVSIYSNADLVIGPSGSALHNAAFMKPGSKIISLTTADFCLLNEFLCCFSQKVKYSIFRCNGSSTEGWSVPIDELIAVLENSYISNNT